MSDCETLEEALSNGYFINGDIFSISRIRSDIKGFIKVFNVRLPTETILDPANNDKSIIILKNPKTKDQIEIISSDAKTLERAKQQLEYQNSPTGLLITVYCEALGGSSDPEQVLHLDELISKLDGLWGWSFKVVNVGIFEAKKRLKSTVEEDAKKELDKLRLLLDFISVTRKIGAKLQRYAVSKIPHYGVSHGIWGPTDGMVSPLTQEELSNLEWFISSSSDVLELARGLNQAYLLTSMPSRLAMFWALTENTFTDDPKPLLTKHEVDSVLEAAGRVPSLVGDKVRLGVLRQAIEDPNRLPIKSRNQRLSENIANLLGMKADLIYSELRKASKVRAEFLHEHKSRSEALRNSEKFLRTIIERYLEKNLPPSKRV